MKTIIITGGTGLLGMRLSFLLHARGYQVRHLSRTANPKATYPAYQWDLKNKKIDLNAFDQVDGIIHLAGANIAEGRWTSKRKKIILDSRIASTALLAETISKLPQKPKVFVSCSAVGYYGSMGNQILTEESPVGNGFMSAVCQQWEAGTSAIRQQGIRTPIVRVGVVLSTQGGALPEFQLSYPVRVGAYFGNGQQYYPWIHIDDICQIFITALENEQMAGIYNGSAPEPATNKAIAAALAKATPKKIALMPVPAFSARLLMGEMANIILNSTRAVPKALEQVNFQFQHPNLSHAIEDLLERKV